MRTISREEYLKLLEAFVSEEREKSARKPVGFFGNWAFHAIMEAEFKRTLEKRCIQIQE